MPNCCEQWLPLSWPVKPWRILLPKQPKTLLTSNLAAGNGSRIISIWISWSLKAANGTSRLLWPARLPCTCMREQTDFSLSRIGRELGGRQPIIVSQAHKKIAENMATDPSLRQTVGEILQKVNQK